MYILGIWDGHDAGSAIINENKILVAINEERETKRKLEVGFPSKSIKTCLNYLNLKPSEIEVVAANTTDFAKTLTRIIPHLKENYYQFRRRKVDKPFLAESRIHLKYNLTEFGSNSLTNFVSKKNIKKKLDKLGFKDYKLYFVDHHLAHAAGAVYSSGMKKGLAITLDGVGDGLSGTVNTFKDGKIKRISNIKARDSLGIFFEQVTNLLGMRELEDEGKVMSLADYSYPIPDEKNRMLDFFKVNNLKIKSKYSSSRRYHKLKKLIWSIPTENFAYMAQYVLEKNIIDLFKNAIEQTGLKNVCWTGGVASNIKANMKVRNFVNKWHIFPHMGDGGLALGSAFYINYILNGIKNYNFKNIYFGTEYSEEDIKKELNKDNLDYTYRDDISKYAADLINKGNFILWFQGRMEYGPRALGNRSILAPAHSIKIKNELNIKIKQRNWFQPFCPSLLMEESKNIFEDIKNEDDKDKYMVMGYKIKKELKEKTRAITHVDGSARPQMLEDENKKYRTLIEQVKKDTGNGIILNTSFNIHGFPIVMNPSDAIKAFKVTKSKYLAIGNFLVEQK